MQGRSLFLARNTRKKEKVFIGFWPIYLQGTCKFCIFADEFKVQRKWTQGSRSKEIV